MQSISLPRPRRLRRAKKQTKANKALAVGRKIVAAWPLVRLSGRYRVIAAISAPLALIVGLVALARRRKSDELPPNESAPGHHPTEAERREATISS